MSPITPDHQLDRLSQARGLQVLQDHSFQTDLENLLNQLADLPLDQEPMKEAQANIEVHLNTNLYDAKIYLTNTSSQRNRIIIFDQLTAYLQQVSMKHKPYTRIYTRTNNTYKLESKMDDNRNGNPNKKQPSNNELLVHTNNGRNEDGTDKIDGRVTKAKSDTTEVDGCFGSMGKTIIQFGQGKYHYILTQHLILKQK